MKAIWNNQILAESDNAILIEGNYYFPPSAVKFDFLSQSDTSTTCYWKGSAVYYTILVNGQMNIDAAWNYPTPNEKALRIKGFVAFWKGIELVD